MNVAARSAASGWAAAAFGLAVAACVCVAALAAAAAPRLQADPRAAAAPAAAEPGLIDLGDGAVAFVPAPVAGAGPAPLLVLMHGAGGDGAGIVRRFAREAEAHGIVLLGLKSKAPSWDLIGARTPQPAEPSRIDRRSFAFRIDPPRIDAELRALFARVPVDPARIGLAGFSDGASYALSVGTANPRLFACVLAFSPGMAELPGRVRSGQRVFVAHGKGDRILSYRVTTEQILPRLRQRRLAVAFRPFDGGHVIPDEVAAEAFRFFLHRPGADPGPAAGGQAAAR